MEMHGKTVKLDSFPLYHSHTILKLNATEFGGCTFCGQLLLRIIVRVCIIEDGERTFLSKDLAPPTSRHGVITL
jgi:hypothetical protein